MTLLTAFTFFIRELNFRRITEKQLVSSEAELAQNLYELQNKTHLLQTTLQEAPIGMALNEAIRDELGRIKDFRILLLNPVCASRLDIPEDRRNSTWLNAYQQTEHAEQILHQMIKVTETGRSLREVVRFSANGLISYLDIFYVPYGDGVMLMFSDITAARVAQLKYQELSQELITYLDGSLAVIVAVDSVRDETGMVKDFRLRYGNETFYKFINLSERQALGRTFLGIHPDMEDSFIFKTFKEVVETGKSARFEQYFPHKGQQRWFEVSVVRQGDGLILSVVEITVQKDYARQATKMQNLLDASLNGVATLKPIYENDELLTFRVMSLNKAGMELVQKTTSPEFISSDSVYLGTSSSLLASLREVFTSGESYRSQIYLNEVHLKGWFDFCAVRSNDELIVTFMDISDLIMAQLRLEAAVDKLIRLIDISQEQVVRLQKTEEELTAALEREKEANTIKSKFVGLVSHEFRTPMATILSGVEIIELISQKVGEEKVNKKLSHYSLQIKQEILRLNNLISDVLMQERLQSNRMTVRPQAFDLVKFCQQRTLKSQEPSRVVFHSEMSAVPVVLDPTLLEHILENLINNALKYSVKSQKPVQVNLDMQRDRAGITVTDYGIGIPAKDLQRMGENFFRASNVGQIQGTGLGLSLVQQFVKMMGGAFRIESEEGVFTSCFVELPLFVQESKNEILVNDLQL